MIFVLKPRRKKPHHLHTRETAIARKLAHRSALAFTLRQMFDQLGDDVSQLVHLSLARDMVRDSAGILDVLVTMEHVPDGRWLRSGRIPHVDGKDQGVAPRVVIED